MRGRVRRAAFAASLLIVPLVLPSCSGSGHGKATSLANGAAAMAFGQRLLGQVVFPRGSVTLHRSPSAALAHPYVMPDWNNLVMPSRFWRLPLSQDATLAYLKAHQLPGTRLGIGSDPAGIGSPPAHQVLSYGVVSPPPSVQMADVLFDVIGVGSEVSEVRGTAQVVWRPDRPPTAYVPKDCTQVLIAQLGHSTGQPPGHEPVVATASVTDAATIARWTAEINRDPTYAQPIRVTGLQRPTTPYRLTFVCPAAGRRVTVYASTGFYGISFPANGDTLTLLDQDGTVGMEAAAAVAGH